MCSCSVSDLFYRPLSWIQSQNMGAFLSVTKGSPESPWLLELHYRGAESSPEEQPIVLVGKGVYMHVHVILNFPK